MSDGVRNACGTCRFIHNSMRALGSVSGLCLRSGTIDSVGSRNGKYRAGRWVEVAVHKAENFLAGAF